MGLILNIDTSTETASVSIARDGAILSFIDNAVQKEHASFLHTAIKNILQQAGVNPDQINAVAVTEGPGSYTGLRVGMAAAKGLSYALNIPFITIGTLTAMAFAAASINKNAGHYYCPMIDARRMEVYTALYNSDIKAILPVCAIVLTDKSFIKELTTNKIIFFGSGMKKWKAITNNNNCIFLEEINFSVAMAKLSHINFIEKNFTELINSQPLYVKEFYNGN